MQADTKAQRIALCEVLSTYGINISNELAGLLLRHLELVIEKNKVLNLTRITSIDEGIDKVCNSCAENFNIQDKGSGSKI